MIKQRVRHSKALRCILQSKGKAKREALAAWLFLLPSLSGIIIFVLLPYAETVRRSFTSAVGDKFVGMQNYKSVFNNDAFRLAFANTARFICICVPLLITFSLAVCLLLRAAKWRGKLMRTALILPMALPVASVALAWQILFNQNGLVNAELNNLHLQAVDFMGTGAAFWLLVGTYIWKNGGFDIILLAAGLDGLSSSLYEAARVDGAGAVASFFYISLPLLSPTLILTAVLSVINTFKIYREAYLTAGNYPHQSIYMLQHLFNNWFTALDLGRLTAAAIIMTAVLLCVIIPISRYWQSED